MAQRKMGRQALGMQAFNAATPATAQLFENAIGRSSVRRKRKASRKKKSTTRRRASAKRRTPKKKTKAQIRAERLKNLAKARRARKKKRR